MADLDFLESLVARPGDTLVIRVQSDVSRDCLDEFVHQAREALPPNIKVAFVAAEQIVVCRCEANDG